MQRLQARTFLVTGATAGIGEATARALAAEGARVVLAARRKDRLAALAKELPGSLALELDVRDSAACERALGGLALAGVALDGAVINAGLGRGLGSITEGNVDEWNEMLDTNVKGVLHTLHAILPGFLARGKGDLVLLGSVAGRQVYPGGNVYCASKHAVRAIYESLRVDLAGKNVRVTTVDPGMVLTDFSITRFRGDRERAAKVYEGMTPLAPSDVADAILYALTRPPHVNVGEIVLWPTDQASTTSVTRRQ
ncbi:MAG: SDR family NAD(P)-dependent oxidoreductase [Planctomycetes bacterium]|nr:SDR family NAD(P)-dependent oxidoreductase [Planctomycetota bacterium]